jgi:hypothetical protein
MRRPKYAVEAERRAFGDSAIYAGVRVSPCPYEGTEADLGEDQAELLRLAERHCREHQTAQKDFQYFAWIRDNLGAVKRISSEPKDDRHPTLPPVQKSFRGICKRLKELGSSGYMRARVFVKAVGPLGHGIVSYDLEQRGLPRISARQLCKRNDSGMHIYDRMRFHLEDAEFFPEPAGPEPDNGLQRPLRTTARRLELLAEG